MTDLDERLFRYFYDADSSTLRILALALSAVGSGWITLALLPLLRFPRWRRFVWVLGAALGVSTIIVSVLKAIVRRPRPFVLLPGVQARYSPPTDASFPSGHACGSFAFAAFVVVIMYTGDEVPRRWRPLITLAVLALAFGIAWSRVYLGVHFPGDVAVGGALGTGSGTMAGWLYRRMIRKTRP